MSEKDRLTIGCERINEETPESMLSMPTLLSSIDLCSGRC